MKKPVKIVVICVSVFLAVIALAIGAFFLIIEPNFKLFDSTELNLDNLTSYSHTVTVLDADGKPIEGALYGSDKIYVKIDELPEYVTDAFVAIEDKRFYSHRGVDYIRMASALLSDLKSRSFREGGSTITQQLIKNTHLSNEKTLKRKIVEIRLARALERVYDKSQIMESYLNILYFGSGIRGLGTASRVIFDKPASELTLAQSAVLASIINNPTKYSPYNNPDNLNARKQLVLSKMLEQKFITQAEYDAALEQQLVFNKCKHRQYISGLLKDACAKLNCSEKQLFLNNATLLTSYDADLTECVRNTLKDYGDEFSVRVVVLDNNSGGIACDETNTTDYINPRRSPASAIKPFISYAPALENGLNPMTQILDEPTAFGDYAPGNYKDVYRGYISLEDGLIYSSNIAAVKLLQQSGIEPSKNVAEKFGLKFSDTDNSLPIALGCTESGVTLVELANAYRTLANGGVYSDTNYLRGVDYGYGITPTISRSPIRAVGDDTAYLITDMLKKCATNGTAKKLRYSGIIAAKTGTNGDIHGNRDCYCVAYTPSHTIAVWFGSNKGTIDNKITGATCCNIVKKLCDAEVINTTAEFAFPDSVAYYDIDAEELRTSHEVYLADPVLPRRYRLRTLLSKRHLPIRNQIDIIDFYDRFIWDYD